MANAFKKGDLVTMVGDWDRKGTCWFRDAVVYSCGKKQMVLTCAQTGEELGRNFRAERGTFGSAGVFPRMSRDEAVKAALALSERVLENERSHFEHCLASDYGEAYNASIRKDLAALHEPRAAAYSELSRNIRFN